jgi:hypothetical protein
MKAVARFAGSWLDRASFFVGVAIGLGFMALIFLYS